ncbi:MAG: hypothetical protein JWN70_977 [Planctomycetaceae bacterium]|nr:hypothetical protein [Planctomycetaceae bacterium]
MSRSRFAFLEGVVVRQLLLCGLLVVAGCAAAETEVRDRYVSYKLVFKSPAGVESARKAFDANDKFLGEGTHVEKIDPGENNKTILVQFQQPETVSKDDSITKLKGLKEIESAEVY